MDLIENRISLILESLILEPGRVNSVTGFILVYEQKTESAIVVYLMGL